ncbi:MAG: AAA family ATPase, partial [Promethearchaeota archaeon]
LFSLFMERVETFHFEIFYQWVLNNRTKTKKGNYQWYVPDSNEYIEAAISTGDAMIRELMKLRKLGIFDVVEEINMEEALEKKVVFIYFPDVEGFTLMRSIFLISILREIYKKKVIENMDFDIESTQDVDVHNPAKIKDDPRACKKEWTNDVSDAAENNVDPDVDTLKEPSEKKANDSHHYPENMDVKPKPEVAKDNSSKPKKKMQMINNLIIIDEAHELLPSRGKISNLSKEFFQFIEKEFYRIAKEGRKYGISLLVATQLVSELNEVVEQNAQTKIFFKLSPKDVKNIKPDKEVINYLDDLKRGQAVVYSMDNLKISKATEIRIIPPVFLHCEPLKAKMFFQDEIERVIKERGGIIETRKKPKPKPLLEKKVGEKDKEKIQVNQFFKLMGVDKLVWNRVTNLIDKSVLDVDIEVLLKSLKKAIHNSGLRGNHFDKILQDLVVALHSENTIGIKLLGPSGEGKTRFAFAIVNAICIGGAKAFFAISESTMEADLFFDYNPKSIADKDVPQYTLGVICQSLIHRTFPILDEANRAPERIYGGKALTALAGDRYIMMPENQLIQAPRDWKIIFIMNPVDIGTFSLPTALEDRLMTLTIPYADDNVATSVLGAILPDHPDVVKAFVRLRHETMRFSPLPKVYHYIPESERIQNPDIQLHGISMRILVRFGQHFKKFYKLLKSKKEAFIRSVDVNCGSIFINNIPEEKEHFNKLVNAVLKIIT